MRMATIIDVSKFQGRIDWRALKAAGVVDGAILKATEGNTGVDPEFAWNAKEAATQDLLLGFYHFAQPDHFALDSTWADPEAEADHFFNTVAPTWIALGRPAMVFALDIEKARNIAKGRPFRKWVRRFVERLESHIDQLAWIYTGGPFFDAHDGEPNDSPDEAEDREFFARRPLWFAAHVEDATPYLRLTPWRHVGMSMHQWSGDVGPRGAPGIRYPGITANVVDTNSTRGTLRDLLDLLEQNRFQVTVEREPSPKSGPATPLRAGDANHTPIHLQSEGDIGERLPDLTKKEEV